MAVAVASSSDECTWVRCGERAEEGRGGLDRPEGSGGCVASPASQQRRQKQEVARSVPTCGGHARGVLLARGGRRPCPWWAWQLAGPATGKAQVGSLSSLSANLFLFSNYAILF